MRVIFTLLFIVFSNTLFCQININNSNGPYPPVSLSQEDSVFLCLIPQLEIPELYTGANAPTLPGSLDNSTQPYFRGVFQQEQYSCGQASSVGYAFTYEINRLRETPANIDSNRYPTHFAWNWMNGGNGWYGVSYYHTFQLLRKTGTPSVESYGGMAAGGPARWIDGYDNYYEAMQNRIHNAYAINTSTPEGISYLKHWLHDHMEGSDVGGVANFYANHPSLHNLPSGTPQAEKKVAIEFSSSSHAMTIVGYNDSICWDYNNDGQYTNDLDITGDGIVDVKDWEIGGFLMVNSYGGVPNWGDEGFCFMMYKSLAMPFGNGGIWNNTVNVFDAKESCNPLLTYKVAVKHNARQKIRVAAGVSSDPSATEPDYEITFPIVDYQGGNFYMQGGTTEEDKTLEFGLDVTELLNHVEPGQEARYFFSVYENDPSGSSNGEIVSFSLMDYTSGVTEINSGFANYPLINNGKTSVNCNASVSYSDIGITTTDLKPVDITLPYADTLEAAGGEEPYRWSKYFPYKAVETTTPLTMIDDEQLSVTSSNAGYATKTLEFDFPFYDKTYNKIYISANGFLFFDLQNYPWPYMKDPKMILRGYRKIAPFDADLTVSGGGIWYEGNSEYAIFRWEAFPENSELLSDLNFGVKLYANGDIELLYGDNIYTSHEWYAGISDGDYVNYEIVKAFDEDEIPVNEGVYFTAPQFIPQLSVSDEGVVEGVIDDNVDGFHLNVAVTDNNNLRDVKSFPLNINGLLASTTPYSGNDTIIEFGETATLDLTIENLSDYAYHQAEIEIHCDDPFITLTDSTETIGVILTGNTIVAEDAFAFTVDTVIPDNYVIEFYGEITSDYAPYPVVFRHTAFAPVIFVESSLFNSEDGNIYPGDTAVMQLVVENAGGAPVTNFNSVMTTSDPYVSIDPVVPSTTLLDRYSRDTLLYEYIVRESAVEGHLNYAAIEFSCQEGISINDSVFINIGGIFEGFETGDFASFPWQFSGDKDWETSSSYQWEGIWSARNKTITHNQESEMYLELNILTGGEISFARKVSSEHNYDFLKFMINGAVLDAWSGEQDWEMTSYHVNRGEQLLRWKYEKDYSEDGGLDCGFVDNIHFPASVLLENTVDGGESMMICEGDAVVVSGSAVNCASVQWASSGDGTFENPNDVETLYYPGVQDINMLGAILTLTSNPVFGNSISDDITFGVYPSPTAEAGNDTTICINTVLPLVNATASGFSNILWSTDGDGYFDDPGSVTPFYTPGEDDYAIGEVTLTLSATGHPECNITVSDDMLLSFHEQPVANAGEDLSIPFGTSTMIDGNASGGSGTYSWYWTPQELFIDPEVQNPQTINLEESFVATLTVTDVETGCVDDDEIVITVTGGELYVSATALPGQVCIGEEVQLMALPGGGSGEYTYSWSSDPAGYESSESAPIVTPEQSVTYFVEVSDGFNTASDQVSVTVNTLPLPDLGEDQLVCIYNTTTLDAGEFNSYLWSNGETTRTIVVDSTGIGMNSAEFSVIVSNESGCINSDTIIVTFDPCTLITETESLPLSVYPVPAKEYIIIRDKSHSLLNYEIYSVDGQKVLSGATFSEKQIDIKVLPKGMYLVKVYCREEYGVLKILVME